MRLTHTRWNTSKGNILCRFEWKMLCKESKIQSTIIPKEAPAMKEIKAPSTRIKVKITVDHDGSVDRRLSDTSLV